MISLKNRYLLGISMLSLLFAGSAIFSLADIQASYDEFRHLEYPAWLVYPLSLSKIAGVYAILQHKSKTLKDFAFAGFLYDLLCALGGHIALQEIKVLVPLAGLAIWIFAFIMDRKYNGIEASHIIETIGC